MLHRRHPPILGLLDEVLHRPPPHFVVRERDGGQRRLQVGRDELKVVEADDRDILGDA